LGERKGEGREMSMKGFTTSTNGGGEEVKRGRGEEERGRGKGNWPAPGIR
jgi:hypothetical protein